MTSTLASQLGLTCGSLRRQRLASSGAHCGRGSPAKRQDDSRQSTLNNRRRAFPPPQPDLFLAEEIAILRHRISRYWERPPTEAAYFAGLRTGLGTGRLKSSSISAKLRSSCNAACIQVLAMSSNTCRCRSDLVSSDQRKHSSANSRNSLGDAGMARSSTLRRERNRSLSHRRLANPHLVGRGRCR